ADRTVEVPIVVRIFLEKGLQLAGVGVECDHAGGVEVFAGARALGLPLVEAPVVVGRRIGRAPEDGVGLRVVATGHPAATAAGLPAVVFPAGTRTLVAADGIELPDDLSGIGVKIGPQHPEYSPPSAPMITLSLTIRGAPV